MENEIKNTSESTSANAPRTKKCKFCKMDIPIDAKVCPHCRKRQKPSGCLIAVLIFLGLMFIAALAGGDDEDEPIASLVETVTPSQEIPDNTEGESAETSSETEPANEFHVGDTVETDDLKITFVSAAPYVSDNMFITPKDGYEFWRFEFSFENISDTNQSVSIMLDWSCYADNTDMSQTFITDDSDGSLDGVLSPGRKAQGAVYFEIPVDAQSIELEYAINYFMDDRIIFVAK